MEGINNRFNGVQNFRSSQKDQRAEIKKNDEEEKKIKKVQVSKDDMYMKWPLRGLAYSNEIGEIIRPMSGLAANLLWVPAIAYIAADVGDKYKHNALGEEKHSKRRAGKEFSFQMLASVLLPTGAVKVGQKLANVVASKGKTKLSLNEQAKFTNAVIDEMDKGVHEKFIDASGNIDRAKFSQHVVDGLKEESKHKKTENSMLRPLARVWKTITKPFSGKATQENINNYVSDTINNIMDTRESLLNGEKPKGLSDKLYQDFEKSSVKANVADKKSIAFNTIKKVQKNKLFKNNTLKSLGGLVALGIMMKPIDNFVENVLVERYISPTIEWVGNKSWKSMPQKVVADKNSNENAKVKS